MELRAEPPTAPTVFKLSIIIMIGIDLLFGVPFSFIT